MAKKAREKLKEDTGSYFVSEKPNYSFVSSGCAVLDCVLGGGYPLGRMTNLVGDKCLSGDTVVSAQRGRRTEHTSQRPRKMTLRTLFERANGNHGNRNPNAETFLTADIGGFVGLARMISIQKTGIKKLYLLTDEHGSSIKASSDHQFSTSEGWHRISDGLSTGMFLKKWRNTRHAERPQRTRKHRASTSGVLFHPFAHQNIAAGKDYKRLLTARLIIEAAINDLSFQEFVSILRNDPDTACTLQYTDPKLDVHHLNGDCTDDRLENLQLIDRPSHWQEHADEMPTNVKRLELAELVSIKECGKEQTFDITMEAPHHNFIANGFVVHNSTAKTGLATEALINFMRQYPDGKPVYRDTEAAFDLEYAVAMGLNKDKVDLGDPEKPIITIEAFMREFDIYLAERIKTKTPGMYVIDSLDALSDEDEMDRDIGKGTYGTAKAKTLSIFFRTTGYKIEQSKVLLLVISQVRDNIGAMFGEKYKRSGGHALDHHASQIVWLSHIKTNKKTIDKVARPTGIKVKAKAKKNKVGLPLRDVEFDFRFGYGIEDVEASVAWLEEVGRLKDADIAKGDVKEYLSALEGMSHTDYEQERVAIGKVVKQVWAEIETKFLPTRQKYA